MGIVISNEVHRVPLVVSRESRNEAIRQESYELCSKLQDPNHSDISTVDRLIEINSGLMADIYYGFLSRVPRERIEEILYEKIIDCALSYSKSRALLIITLLFVQKGD